ncbi:MAG: ornithine cyclodeaminase family protein [Desulfobacteraceae bacterium]|nr:ornithine cyclodeaminase family protein [Desulfobacteraceae bacterium]
MSAGKTIVLTAKDIHSLNITFADTYRAIREALVEHGKKSVLMPPKFGIHPQKVKGAHCNAMPAYVPKLEALGIKWVSGFPGNPEKALPYIMGTLIINDDETGVPLAIMEASWITAMRTAGVAGLAAQACAKPDAAIMGLVGAGVQGRFCLRAVLELLPGIEEIRIYDINPGAIANFVEEMGRETGRRIIAAKDARDALEPADIMVTATSFVDKPFVLPEWLREGDLGILIHHRGWKNEAFFAADKLVVDDWPQTRAYGMEDNGFYGDLPHYHAELGEILAGIKTGRENSKEKIIAITCGLAIEDMSMGKMIYEMARTKGIGACIDFC